MTKQTAKFNCSYPLDQRPDLGLVRFNQELYRSIQEAFGESFKLHFEPDGWPNAVQYYLLYTAALIHGAADAALTLVLHNLGREARLLERQVFECWVRSAYYAEHPAHARLALLTTPFQEKRILDELGYSKKSSRYRKVLAKCREAETLDPAVLKFSEPALHRIIASSGDDESMRRFYALHYRVTSQMAHGTFAGVGGVLSDEGVSFDSRMSEPNYTLEAITVYVLAFLELANKHLQLNIADSISRHKLRWKNVQSHLHS